MISVFESKLSIDWLKVPKESELPIFHVSVFF